MQDVEKTEIHREEDEPRNRRRSRHNPLQILIVVILVIGIGVALILTIFFNIQTIEIAGESSVYTAEDIAKASGVHTGDHLMRLNAGEVRENILNRLVFVDDVSIKKNYPGTLVITVTPSRPAYNLVDESGTLQVSATGKILKNSPETDHSLPTIVGYEPKTREAGKILSSKDSQKDQILELFVEVLDDDITYPITRIDMTDKYNIVVTFDNRIEFSMGSWSDMTYKITLAQTVMTELADDASGYLTMIGDHQCSYRETNTSASAVHRASEAAKEAEEAAGTDENDEIAGNEE